ncbi:aminopeptidase N [Vibrio sp. RC27]
MSHSPKAKYRKDYVAPTHHITNVDLTFDLHDTETTVVAISEVEQTGKSDSLVLAGDNLQLVSLSINEQEWHDYQRTESELIISNLPNSFTMVIVTQIAPVNNTALEGLYKSEGAFCTQCEAEGFRRITYYLDRPDNLACFTTTVIADKSLYPYLLSNGNELDRGELTDGKHWVSWEDPHPKPAYLFALVAGDFDVLRDIFITKSKREVALEIYVDKGNLNRAHHAMASLINSMKWDEERFGLEYDLDIYMIVAVDFFNMGAMENKGLNVFNSKFVLANEQTATDTDYLGIEAVIGHEYFHNWTGNRVTCRDWFQLSLKEGLTVFRDQEFSSDLGSRAVNRINNVRIIRGPQFAEDASPMSHPIRPDKVIEMNNFYTLTVYEKGSEVIRMMHTLLGEDGFQKGMKLYFERHDGTAATCENFVSAMEDASGINLTQFRRWYSQSGTPELYVTTDYLASEKRYTVTIKQSTPPTNDQGVKEPLHIPFDVEFYYANGDVVELQCNGKSIGNVLNITEEEQTFEFEAVTSQPIPSMLREFSAPVKLHYDYSDDELVFLMAKSKNDFARWDAGQSLLAKYIKRFVASNEEVTLPENVVDAYRGALLDSQLEPAFIAEMLTLPGHNEVSGWYQTVDVDRIAQVLKGIKIYLANQLQDELLASYHVLKQTAYSIEHESIGKRTLRNTCLGYLAYLEVGNSLVVEQYNTSNNMTDTMAAMTAANQASLSCRETLLADYSDKWSNDGLVMDKWFILQGTNPAENALEVVKNTLTHSAFTFKNPNRIRSLVGSFFNNNPTAFHSISGEGYQFAGEVLVKLNASNPQVASRLIDPLLKFKRYDEKRQKLMKEQLEMLAAKDDLASDLYEKVTKALESK